MSDRRQGKTLTVAGASSLESADKRANQEVAFFSSPGENLCQPHACCALRFLPHPPVCFCARAFFRVRMCGCVGAVCRIVSMNYRNPFQTSPEAQTPVHSKVRSHRCALYCRCRPQLGSCSNVWLGPGSGKTIAYLASALTSVGPALFNRERETFDAVVDAFERGGGDVSMASSATDRDPDMGGNFALAQKMSHAMSPGSRNEASLVQRRCRQG